MVLRILVLITLFSAEAISGIRVRRNKYYEPRVFASCFEDIGCIDFTDKWYHEKWRPRNLEPLDRHTIRTEFLLMKSSKNNKNDLVYDVMSLKKETIEVSGFKNGTCSIFIIHDFTSNGYTGWIKHLVVAFARKTDCNIISVDWQAGAEPPFEQAISNARVVALEARAFIMLINSCFAQSTDNLHLIGHGVGAHIAGYIGKYIPNVQRITGLDPTGPYFAKMHKDVRLDANDAKYVEILHTDSYNHRSQGTKVSLGHADFVINNSEHQPGCNDSSHFPSFIDLHRDTLKEGKILPACSHKRSFKYYIQALQNEDCQFIGISCKDHDSFINGKCNDCKFGDSQIHCASFGLEPPAVTSRNNTFFISTNGNKPYCMVAYAVNITIYAGPTTKEVEGYFDLILVDENEKVANASSNIEYKTIRKMVSGHTYDFIFHALPPSVNRIKEAKVRWNYKSKKICIMCDKAIFVKEISIKRLSLKNNDMIVTNLICPTKMGAELKTGDYVEFQSCTSLYGPEYETNGHRQELLKKSHTDNQFSPPETGVAQGLGTNTTFQFICDSAPSLKNKSERTADGLVTRGNVKTTRPNAEMKVNVFPEGSKHHTNGMTATKGTNAHVISATTFGAGGTVTTKLFPTKLADDIVHSVLAIRSSNFNLNGLSKSRSVTAVSENPKFTYNLHGESQSLGPENDDKELKKFQDCFDTSTLTNGDTTTTESGEEVGCIDKKSTPAYVSSKPKTSTLSMYIPY